MTNIPCDDVVCRAREDREDIACQRTAGHDGGHIHTRALGCCRRPHLAGPGHVPFVVAIYEEARLEGLRQDEVGEIESRITMYVGHMREDYE